MQLSCYSSFLRMSLGGFASRHVFFVQCKCILIQKKKISGLNLESGVSHNHHFQLYGKEEI